MSSRLDGSTIFKGSSFEKSIKNHAKNDPKLRPKNGRKKRRKKWEKREEKERKMREKINKKGSKKKREKREEREVGLSKVPNLTLRRYLLKGRLPWKPPLFDLRTLGFIDAWLKKVVWGRLEGRVNILGYLGGHFGSLGAPFGLILALLGRLLDPFWLSWDVLGRLGTPFSPKSAQVGPR